MRSSWQPQYWHWKRSRRKTLNRVKAGVRTGFTNVLSDTTLGSRITKVGLWTAASYSETMFTRSRNTALIVSCHDQSESG